MLSLRFLSCCKQCLHVFDIGKEQNDIPQSSTRLLLQPAEKLSVAEAKAALQAPTGAKICQLGQQLDTMRQVVDEIQDDVNKVAATFAEVSCLWSGVCVLFKNFFEGTKT